jgi:hypothetical protein
MLCSFFRTALRERVNKIVKKVTMRIVLDSNVELSFTANASTSRQESAISRQTKRETRARICIQPRALTRQTHRFDVWRSSIGKLLTISQMLSQALSDFLIRPLKYSVFSCAWTHTGAFFLPNTFY